MATHMNDNLAWHSVQSSYFSKYVIVISATCYVYDCLLTFPREVNCFWRRKLSAVHLLYIANRYASLCFVMLNLIQLVPWDKENLVHAERICVVAIRLERGFTIVIFLVFMFFASLRTYAVWDQSRVVLVCMLSCGMIYPIGYVFYVLRLVIHASPPPGTGCNYYTAIPAHPQSVAARLDTDKLISVYSVVACMTFECLTIVLTLIKVIPTAYQLRPTGSGFAPSFSRAILHNGTLHFAAICTANALSLLGLMSSTLMLLINFAHTFTSILMARFILNLAELSAGKMGDQSASLSISDLTGIQFNISEPHESESPIDVPAPVVDV